MRSTTCLDHRRAIRQWHVCRRRTPSFVAGSSGSVFTTLGTSTTFGDIAAATLTTIIRTNFTPSADYNHNGFVDAADYVLWRNTKNLTVAPGTGADGNSNGIIDQPDYDLWRANFGNAAVGAGSGGSLSTSAVPEPFSGPLLALGAMLLSACADRIVRAIRLSCGSGRTGLERSRPIHSTARRWPMRSQAIRNLKNSFLRERVAKIRCAAAPETAIFAVFFGYFQPPIKFSKKKQTID